jgi:branched-chain amino acid transport system substrate-binding protein
MRENNSLTSICNRYLGLSLFFCLLWGISLCPCPVFGSSPGISDTEIVLGQSCALKGPAQALGKGMRDGALVYFRQINSNGGIRGRKIRLITYDDGYEPTSCLKNTDKLISQDGVFVLFGFVGTPTSRVAVPIATEKKVPYFAPYTGAEFLRNPLNRQVFNIRASYYQETDAMVEHLIKDIDIKRISVFYQNDSYGKTGLEGVRIALAKRGLNILNSAYYLSNTVNVEQAVEALNITRPEAIIMIGTHKPCARFIQLMRKSGSEALFLNVSFVDADSLGAALANEGLGVVITQVVSFPYDKRIPVVSEFYSLAEQFLPEAKPSFVCMEGFIAAKAFCKILLKTPDPITRKDFINTAESQANLDLGGFSISFSKDNHQGSNLVYFSQVGPGGFISPLNDLNYLYEYNK